MGPELDKPYEPSQVEPRWAREWKQRGYFHAQDASDKPPYCIVLPPPNVTGSLHLGHALTATIEDALIRWKRMSGFNALWQPGIDHAGTMVRCDNVVSLPLKDLGRSRLPRAADVLAAVERAL